MNHSHRALAIGTIAAAALLACQASWAQASDPPSDSSVSQPDDGQAVPPDSASGSAAYSRRHTALERLAGDVKSYYTAPLRWGPEQWAFFGGVVGAVALSHHYDSNVRAHFVQGSGIGGSTSSLQDAVPAAALWAGTYIYSSQWHDRNGFAVTWGMLEAAGLSTVTTYALKYVIRRQGPYETTDPNQWFASGNSFPSEHATAAFAIGTVFAESGSGGYRWLTRALGYGVASFTAYERLKHNAHWLSDVVAGAAIGGSTGLFVADRTFRGVSFSSAFNVVPTDGGVMLAFHKTF